VSRDRPVADRRVVVVGGGLAGIAAALDCAAAGASATVVEVRRRLGGAAYSFERNGLEMDNGQHVFLRCCLAYRALLRRLGSDQLVRLQPRLEIPVLKPGSAPVVLRRSSLPAPLHLAGALARYRHLSVGQRLAAARAAIALMRLDRAGGAGADAEDETATFGDWLARHGQGPDAVSALWDLISLPTLNLPAAQASLALSAFVFQTGLLSAADAGDIGFHAATLSRTIAEPAERALRQAGAELRLGWRAEQLRRTADGFELLGRGQRDAGDGQRPEPDEGEEPRPAGVDAESLRADAVIVALPHSRAATLLEPLLGPLSRRLRRLGSSPIVNLHVLYDRQVCDVGFAAGIGTPVQYIFDRTAAAGAPAGSQYLAISLSGAEREMQMSVPALRERYLPALRQLLPRAAAATVELFVATREHAATFRAAPGVGALRPPAPTAIPGLALAGAWTATGWPATLEGAVLSGHAAAASALKALGIQAPASGQEAPASAPAPAAMLTEAGVATP